MDQQELFAIDSPDGPPREVADLFIKLARDIQRQGFARYSADAILHRIRWHYQIERGQRDFKCNNNWTARLARSAMDMAPDLEGFFETRKSPGASQ